MQIETVDDLANTVADWIGCYGGCKALEGSDGCDNPSETCCRVGFMMTFPDRIRNAVENDMKIEKAGLRQ